MITINRLKAHLNLQIRNQDTAKSYPQNENISQSLAINAMRIEVGIKFLYTPLSAK